MVEPEIRVRDVAGLGLRARRRDDGEERLLRVADYAFAAEFVQALEHDARGVVADAGVVDVDGVGEAELEFAYWAEA